MIFTVYILRTSSNTLYIGQTNNLEKRLKDHQDKSAKSAKYMKYFDSFKLVYSEECQTRTEVMKREYELKQWSKAKKEALINKCVQCGVCCRLFLINLSEEEYKSGKFKTQFEKFGLINDFKKASMCGANIIKQKKDGSCIYLKDKKCSIHKLRPEVCREFFCASKLKKFKNMTEQIKKKKIKN